jgi:hypothetical protein
MGIPELAPVRFTSRFFDAWGRKIRKNYEAVSSDGQDDNAWYVWVRDLEHGYLKYITVSKRKRIEKERRKLDTETRKMIQDWEWEYLDPPLWLDKLFERENRA